MSLADVKPLSKPRQPIVRWGGWDAMWYVVNKNHSVHINPDGHAEVWNESNEAVGFLTRSSVKRYQVAMKRQSSPQGAKK